MPARRPPAVLLACLPLLFVPAAGCRSNNELLEAELRSKDNLYRDALDEQRKAEAHAEALQRELFALRNGGARLPPEVAAQAYGVRRIALGRGTGGTDQDGLPGDEILQIVVEPRDSDDHVIKAAGALQVCAVQVDPQGLKAPLSTWEFGPEDLRRTWKQGLLSTGYVLTLPWKAPPQTENLRIVVRLTTADGRAFEADRDVKVRLLPGALPRASEPLPLPDPLPPPTAPGTLPMPRQLPPNPLPPPTDPLVVPSSKGFNRTSNWAPAPLTGAVYLGRPEPMTAPPPPLEGWLRR